MAELICTNLSSSGFNASTHSDKYLNGHFALLHSILCHIDNNRLLSKSIQQQCVVMWIPFTIPIIWSCCYPGVSLQPYFLFLPATLSSH